MWVRAIQLGYFDHKRHYPKDHTHPRAGQAFEIPDDLNAKTGKVKHFSTRWMEPINPDDVKNLESAKEAVAESPEVKEPARRGRPPKVRTE